jgi:hypothetical protein
MKDEDICRHLAHLGCVSERPGMYLPEDTYDCFVSYVLGYDDALGGVILKGFREWATMLLNQQANFGWSAVALGVLLGDMSKKLVSIEENRAAIAGLHRLISEFVSERGDDLAATQIFARYSAWEQERKSAWKPGFRRNMGAWGVHALANDPAQNWADDLVGVSDLGAVQSALDAVLETEYLDADVACEGLAACEVIARLKGNFGVQDADTETLDRWVRNHPAMPSDDLVRAALAAIDKILAPRSELLAVWEEERERDAGRSRLAVADLWNRLV